MACNNSSQDYVPRQGDGFTTIDYQVAERDRYDNVFRDNIPNQWESYGIGDPFLMRFNGKYYLYTSTKDNNLGYKCWVSEDLITYEYLGHFMLYNKDGVTTNGQSTQYAPEVYYWNGNFYMYGSPAGNGHYIYKSTTGLPYGDYVAITDNFGCSIDGSVFIDDDETMMFMTAGDGAIQTYEMNSMEEVDVNTADTVLAPLVKWTEGPAMIKHNGTYYLTYTGNHVKSKGYRIDYSYSKTSSFFDFTYPANNSVVLNTLTDFNGLGHSSTVLGPNLDSYYMAYHSLDSASGPIRSFNINRLSFANNRMSLYGPTEKGAMVPLLPDFISYEQENMDKVGNLTISKKSTGSRFSAEYNFSGINNDGSLKLFFSYQNNVANYVTIVGKTIELHLDGALAATGSLVNDFNFMKLHTIRLQADNGHYRVFFDNLKKIDVQTEHITTGGNIGYSGASTIGATVFSNDAFDSSDNADPKIVKGDAFATKYLAESKLTGDSGVVAIADDDVDYDAIYKDASAVKLSNVGDYLLYPIDVLEDGLYGFELLLDQASAGSVLSVQIDNGEANCFQIKKSDFSQNMNDYESQLQFTKQFVAEKEISKGAHVFKIELVRGKAQIAYWNIFKDSKYKPDYAHDLSTYITNGASYLSLWKLSNDNGTVVHKAKAGVNNMVLLGAEGMTNYEVSVDIKIGVSSANNSMAGVIVRTNNPSLFSGYVDQSAQGYFISFNRMQLMLQRINYNGSYNAVKTGDDITLGEYHNLKVNCMGNKISVFFDDQFAFSYTDPYPYSHGLVTLYSVNAESYYKNLSIKGI